MDELQVIAEPKRRQILALVWDREMAAAEVASHFDVTFGAISQHLGILREAGMVKVRKDGNRRFYKADQNALAPFKEMLELMWGEALRHLAVEIESNERDQS